MEKYVEAVNEKNELVHEYDSQEKLITKDKNIRSLVANREILNAKPGGTKQLVLVSSTTRTQNLGSMKTLIFQPC